MTEKEKAAKAEEKADKAAKVNAQTAGTSIPKAETKKRTGITRETRGAAITKLIPNPNENNGLCLGNLVAVNYTESVWDTDKDGYKSFKGKNVPRLTFIFKGLKTSEKDPGMHFHSFNAIPYNQDDWKTDQIFQYIKHFLDVLIPAGIDVDAYWDIIEPLLGCDASELKDADEIIAAFATFFKNVVTVFNGSEDLKIPSLINVDDLLWIKLLLYFNNKEVNRGDFGFPMFPGDGVIERAIQGVPPTMRIRIEKGESIIPREKPTAQAPILPAAGSTGGAPAGGAPANAPSWMTGGQQ